MKHNNNHNNARDTDVRLWPVRFEYTHPTAKNVSVAGTFNEWHPTTKSMRSLGRGHWFKEMSLAPGSYEYRLVVDGQWMTDPLAKDCVPNPFGGTNSVVNVARSPEMAHLIDAENLPLKNANKK